MTVEVSDSGFVIVENGSEPNLSVDDEKVSITFGSHSVEEPVKVEVKNISEPNVPKDAVDEWPEPQQVHSFYVARYRALEDQSLKGKLDLAEKELQKKNQARMQSVEKIKAKRVERAEVVAQIRSLSVENRQYRSVMDEKRKEMEPLTQALGKLRGGDRGSGICSSEKELNDLIKSLQLRIQHESIPLTEEKQIMREIKLLEGTRPKVIANSAERARIQESMGEKDAIQGQVKSIGVDLDGAWKEKQVINAKLKQLDEEKLVIEKAINNLEEELTAITEKRDKTFETIRDMRKQREEGNSPFYEYRYLLNKMKALADNKDVDSLKELSETEVDKFMSLWNSKKGFRDDYEKRILSSLDMRQLSKDGRLRNPNEKPLVRVETAAPTPASNEVLVPKASAKQIPKDEEPVAAPAKEDEQKGSKTKGGKNTNKIDSENNTEEEEYFVSEKPKEAVKVEVDEKKLKELRREEEIAKRKEAEERKKKMAEKAAAKAAIKAQKEAEKKLKEREKKAKKKAGGAFTALESEESATEVVEEVEEAENVEEKKEIPQKTRGRKENTVRQRARPRGLDSLPKAILKRKKVTNYWVWGAASAAAVAIVLLVFVGYNHLS